jgi:hypothetical protein
MLGPLISGRANRPVKAATTPSVKPEYQVSTAVPFWWVITHFVAG